MPSRLMIACTSLVVLLGLTQPARAQQNPYRLKDPDQKKICIACHSEFDQKLKKRFIHTPVRSGECSGCHDPHVSSHGKLLSSEPRQICGTCHDAMIPAKARSAHKVVADRQCEKCHDPHASDTAQNLVGKGNELCLGCHKDLAEALKSAKFKHSPVEAGCLSCHEAHASEQAVSLLKRPVPALCVNCHKPDTATFAARHKNYPVGKADCTACHDPHGSNAPALMLGAVHAPVAAGTCDRCHEAPNSPTPFATKQTGFQLCRGCHSDMVDATMAKARLHWPVADKRGCVNCHNPHASRFPKLVRAAGAQLCKDCHADTVARIAATTVKHAPVEGGNCVACHSPHSSRGVLLIDQPSIDAACSTCHDYSQHSAHPIGEKAVDPRNPNLRVNCLNCHKAHGTEFKRMLLAGTNVELCTACHKKFAR